jgi:hypothetical protein
MTKNDEHTERQRAEGNPRFQTGYWRKLVKDVAVKPPAPPPDPVRLSAALENYLVMLSRKRTSASYGHRVHKTHAGRAYTFYWHRQSGMLLVKVGPKRSRRRNGFKSDPILGALIDRIVDRRACQLCGKVFQRDGKRKFCTEAHATTWRTRKKRGLLASQTHTRVEQEKAEENKAVIARLDAALRDGARKDRAAARRRQRARKARRAGLHERERFLG